MSWCNACLRQRLKLPPVGEHQAGAAQKFELNRVVLRQLVAQGRDDGRIEPLVIEGHLILVRGHVAIHQAARDFGEQFRHAHQVVELQTGINIHRRLPKGVAEKADAAQTVTGQLFVYRHQDHLFVLIALTPVVGVRGKRELTPMRWLGGTFDSQKRRAIAVGRCDMCRSGHTE